MRIDDVRTAWLRVPLDPPIADSTHVLKCIDWILVEVRAGDLAGASYMLSFDYAPQLLKGVVDTELRRHLLGEDAENIGSVFHRNLQATEYIGQQGLAMWGLSAIDTALWDLMGKRTGLPVSVLFGRCTTSVPAYGSGGWLSYSDEKLADEVSKYLKRGFKAVKIKVGSSDLARDVSRIQAIRSAVGPDVQLMIDANQALTLDRALRLVRQVEPFNIHWLEEPFPKCDLESYSRLARVTGIPLAAGEREFGVDPFRRLIAAQAISVVQPDLMRVGGVTGWRAAAMLASVHHLRVAPHFYKEHDVHLAAATPNLIAIEWFDWLDPLLVNPLQLVDGCAVVPNRPGFGVEFKPEAIREYEVKAS